MKTVEVDKLKIGDWILAGNTEMGRKFQVARVSGINFDKVEDFDLIKGDISEEGRGEIKENRHIQLLNKKELKALHILRTKLKTLKGLEEKPIRRKIIY